MVANCRTSFMDGPTGGFMSECKLGSANEKLARSEQKTCINYLWSTCLVGKECQKADWDNST